MTGTIDDTFTVSGPGPHGPGPHEPGLHGPGPRGVVAVAAAELEQAKGVLIFRYSISAEAAQSLMELWAADAAVDVGSIAAAIVRDICGGQESADPHLVRWLEGRLRQEATPSGGRGDSGCAAEPPTGPAAAVAVEVGHSDVSLDAVVQAVRTAARLGVALELTVSGHLLPGTNDATRAHLLQRLDLAAELARSLEPGVEVRLPEDDARKGGG